MKIGLLCSSDWANYLYQINESLKAVNVDTVACKLAKHPFNYENELEVIGVQDITERFKDCDITLICHSDHELIPYLTGRYGHVATGSKFRNNPDYINEQFKGSVINFTDQCEFMKLNKFIYLPVPIDTDKIKPIERTIDKVTFAHYPSNPGVKGSEVIDSIMRGYNYKTSHIRVFHNEQLDRMQDCDVYIELYQHSLGGKEYGCFGVTAFEAAAMGKVVITMCNDKQVYEDAFGLLPFNIVKSEMELKAYANIFTDVERVIEGGKQARQKMVERHSLKSSGERLKDILWLYQS